MSGSSRENACRAPGARRGSRLLCALAALLLAPRGGALCAETLGTNGQAHLARALAHLNMTPADLAFQKDLAQPRLALPRLRAMLTNVWDLPAMADEIRSGCADPGGPWGLARRLLELPPPAGVDAEPAPPSAAAPAEDLDPELSQALAHFAAAAAAGLKSAEAAFADLDARTQIALAASVLADSFNAEDRPAARAALAAGGIPAEQVGAAIREGQAIDPEPAATRFLDAAERIDLAPALDAAARLHAAAGALAGEAGRITRWPAEPRRVATALGDLWIGSTNADRYAQAALLILDPGGNDTYEEQAGAVNGLTGARAGVIVDLGGHDTYRSSGILGAGAALFGVSIVLDADGDDVYRAAYTGQGAGLFGVGCLEDRAGRDVYEAEALAQGAAVAGVGVLRDKAGDDQYRLGWSGQAYASLRAVGLLVDEGGNDRYLAGGREPDHERHPERYVSLAQGFATGLRPFAGGGVAALVDRAGNDVYDADVYGQGVAYWYAAGFLLDDAGHDSYRVYHYGQGSGIHLSLGLLSDGEGDDDYSGRILVQGNAHDYAVGMLLDRRGNDTYTADLDAQGHGMNNAIGLLLDEQGRDVYLARDTQRSQGVGQDGSQREYGSLGLLLDLEGTDTYACGAGNGCRIARPNFGIIYDLADPKK